MSMMLTFRARRIAIQTVFVFLVAACSREQQDWRSAEAADTVESYGQFLDRHPDSELATQARTRVAQLAEEREWKHASTTDTADAYREFLAQHPNGKWAQEARIRIQNFALNGLPPAGPPMVTAPDTTVGAGGAAAPPASAAAAIAAPGQLAHAAGSAQMQGGHAPAAPLSNIPTSFSSANGASANAPSGYGVQLGAFGSESAANNEWQLLKSRFGAQLQGLTPRIVAANTSTGTLFRLQAQVAGEAQARSLCDMLKQQSQPCVPVLPH
jgi:cell division septation protein DedD